MLLSVLLSLGQSSSWFWSSKPTTGPIKFYNRDDPYYEFTNFYSAPIELDKKTWPTTEHYFQAQKFVGTPYEEKIRHLPRPQQVLDFTQDPKVSRWRRNDWESIKQDVMYKALLAKFTQHDCLRKLLLRTEERKLVEHSPYDSYWGDGGDGTGKSRLGELLMRLRRELRSGKKGKKSASVLPHLQCIEQGATRQNLQQSSQSGQSGEQSGGTPPSTSAYGDLQRPPLQKQPSHPDYIAMDYQPSNASDDNTGKDPSASNTLGTTSYELHSPTARVYPSLTVYQRLPSRLVTTASLSSQEEDSDFTEVGMPLKTSLTLLQTPFKGGGSWGREDWEREGWGRSIAI